jgi:O-antigen/teichoic acid export membrane protein
LPGFALVMVLWMHFSVVLVAMSLLIVVGEHLANQAYQMSMINQRYRRLMLIVLAKNSGLLAAVGWHIVIGKDLTLIHVVRDWFVVTIFSIVLLAVATWRIKARNSASYPFDFELFRHQYAASFAHFLIGLVALLSVQMDRLVAGAILPGAQTGSYFRQVLLVSLVYQLFNIASYNRILPGIYHKARTETVAALRPLVRREHLLVICVTVTLYAGILLVGSLPGVNFFERFHLRPELLAVLFVGFVIRAGADLNSIMLNGKGLEKYILLYQTSALAVGFVFYVALAWKFGIAGAVSAALIAPSVYLFLSSRALSAHNKKEVMA